jgi:hypothetical protein
VEATNDRFGGFQREIEGQAEALNTSIHLIEEQLRDHESKVEGKLKKVEDNVADDYKWINDLLKSHNNIAKDFEARFPKEHGAKVDEELGSRSPRGSQDGD